MANSNQLLIGPSGWNRPDWAETVYPSSYSRAWHRLDLLARYVDLLEIDQTFHEPLRGEIARLYAKKVDANPRFRFTALLGRCFTYDRDLRPETVAAWRAGFAPLERAGRLAAVVAQFPWAFRFSGENRAFLVALRKAFGGLPLVAELRHDSWLVEEAITVLAEQHIGLVNLDQPNYFRAMPPATRLTSGVAMVRLVGRHCPEAFRDFDAEPRSDYLYDIDELLEWKPRVERLAAHAPSTLVVTTNATAGHAMVNALQMREILGGDSLLAPEPLIGRYPAELAAFRSRRPVQTLLLDSRAA